MSTKRTTLLVKNKRKFRYSPLTLTVIG